MSFIWNSVVTEIVGNGKVESVRLRDVVTGADRVLPASGIFIYIGHRPNTELFAGQLEMDEHSYLVTDKWMHTSAEGVFAAGEVADPRFRQVITSAGMGAAAAIEAEKFLAEHAGEPVLA
jgi:thioredoxin reductase (NADPH)